MLFQYGGGMFQDTFYYLQQWGILDVLVPFVLIFTIIFAVLQKISLFGEKRYNAVIALAITLTAIVPHILGTYPPGMDVIAIMNASLPETVLLIVAVVLLMVMLGLIWGEWPEYSTISGIAAIIAGLILVGIFVSNLVEIPILSWISPEVQTLIIVLIVFGLIFLYVTWEKDDSGPKRGSPDYVPWVPYLYKKYPPPPKP
ncbi:hypothetical protein KY338_02155 [Candidatus Woesearchaeota archaeon]|nr:hypothetical protein [Candidatus Woesearchaeota archaeon]MBW3006094.1 hypothetical protein [Candidatus Woesearchaeota archaeon]